jgi:hypothetical protein
MKFSNFTKLLILSSLSFLFFPQLLPAGPAEGQGRDAILPSQQNAPKSEDSSLPAAPATKAQLPSGGAGSGPGAPGPETKSVNGAQPTGEKTPASPARGKKRDSRRKKKSIYRLPSVLERFRDYRGERAPEAFTALFDRKQTFGFRQDPPVVLSDGKAVVRLLFVSTPERENISDVALTGGRAVAAMKDAEATNTWIIAVLPEKGTDELTMALLQSGVLMVFPVAVAPQVDIDLNKSGNVTEEDFRMFLKDRGTLRAPVYDLNGDGVRDFRDDYLFTANYLALKPAREPAAATLAPSAPADLEDKDESLYEQGDTVEQLPPEVEPEEDEAPDL